jgi:serine/threonine-protein kinase PknK
LEQMAPTHDNDELWLLVERSAALERPLAACEDLARLILSQTKAERVFVLLAREDGTIAQAWGTDFDGVALVNPAERLSAELIKRALRHPRPLYQPDIETPAGHGSRLLCAQPARASGPRAVNALIVLEHRFRIGHFEAVSETTALRWAALAGLLGRFVSVSEPVASLPANEAEQRAEPSSQVEESSTALPVRPRRYSFKTLIGEDPAFVRAVSCLDSAVDSELPVLILGETGVGKELFARALHEHGPRARAPFVAANCAAIPDSLFEAEFFGHARGSFTGALAARRGLIAEAEGGTLFLDEVAELPLTRQASLLRALSTRHVRTVGSDEERPFDVRIIAATNRSLTDAVKSGLFRQDLLYRLNVLEIRVPALRERPTDITLLAEAFLKRSNSRAKLSRQALAALEAYAWPGNVRELEHQMLRLAATGLTQVELEHLPRSVRAAHGRPVRRRSEKARALLTPEIERREVERALARASGNITRAAAELGITRHGLKKRMARLGLRGTEQQQPRARKLQERK